MTGQIIANDTYVLAQDHLDHSWNRQPLKLSRRQLASTPPP